MHYLLEGSPWGPVSQQWPLSGTQAPGPGLRRPEDFLLPTPEHNQLPPALRPLLLLLFFVSFLLKRLFCPGQAPADPMPSGKSRPVHTLEQPVHLPSETSGFLLDFSALLWALSPGGSGLHFPCSPSYSQREYLLAHSRCSTETVE